MPEYLGDTENGQLIRLGRYGECELSLLGRYQLENAALAVQGVGNMHARLKGIAHGSPEYVEGIRSGLGDVRWPGRMHKLQDAPQVIVDGAVNVLSARSFLQSVESRLTQPVVTVIGAPQDRDYEGVYSVYAEKSDALVITSSTINPRILFPDRETALAAAGKVHDDVQYGETLPEALELAYAKAGDTGTVLLAVAQPLVGEAMMLWDIDMSEI
jgi:dihydrofolate synthase/folylpolyglutamate synthase